MKLRYLLPRLEHAECESPRGERELVRAGPGGFESPAQLIHQRAAKFPKRLEPDEKDHRTGRHEPFGCTFSVARDLSSPRAGQGFGETAQQAVHGDREFPIPILIRGEPRGVSFGVRNLASPGTGRALTASNHESDCCEQPSDLWTLHYLKLRHNLSTKFQSVWAYKQGVKPRIPSPLRIRIVPKGASNRVPTTENSGNYALRLHNVPQHGNFAT